eukprot:6120230-Amphidinium_carterae.1
MPWFFESQIAGSMVATITLLYEVVTDDWDEMQATAPVHAPHGHPAVTLSIQVATPREGQGCTSYQLGE